MSAFLRVCKKWMEIEIFSTIYFSLVESFSLRFCFPLFLYTFGRWSGINWFAFVFCGKHFLSSTRQAVFGWEFLINHNEFANDSRNFIFIKQTMTELLQRRNFRPIFQRLKLRSRWDFICFINQLQVKSHLRIDLWGMDGRIHTPKATCFPNLNN